MKETLLEHIHKNLSQSISEEQWSKLKPGIWRALCSYEITPLKEANITEDNLSYLDMYLSAKHIEGCSEKTLHHYKLIIERLLKSVDHGIAEITTAAMSRKSILTSSAVPWLPWPSTKVCRSSRSRSY